MLISATERWLHRKLAHEEKIIRKSTYPPPADGVCVLFLCKVGSSANEAAVQAGRGALQVIGNFTDCKVLKRNAARLHSSAMGVLQQRKAEVPGPIGRKNEKHRNSWVFSFGWALLKAPR